MNRDKYAHAVAWPFHQAEGGPRRAGCTSGDSLLSFFVAVGFGFAPVRPCRSVWRWVLHYIWRCDLLTVGQYHFAARAATNCDPNSFLPAVANQELRSHWNIGTSVIRSALWVFKKRSRSLFC